MRRRVEAVSTVTPIIERAPLRQPTAPSQIMRHYLRYNTA